jgi:hypothetical protein
MTMRRGLSIASVVLLVWFVAVLWWAFQPLVDHVPTGVVDNVSTSQAVTCVSPLSGDAGAVAPLPDLAEGRSYQRTPCVATHQEAHLIFWVDAAVTVVLLALLAWRLAMSPTDEPVEAKPEADART